MFPALSLALLAAAPTVDLWFGGDVHLGNDGSKALTGLAQVTRGSDGVVNFEGVISLQRFQDSPDGGSPRLFQSPKSAEALKAAGVSVVSLANNHAADDGPEGVRRTREELRKAGISAAEQGAPPRLSVGGLSVTVAAFDLSSKAAPTFEKVEQGVLVVSLHVGGPSVFLPSPATRAAVESALKAGASVVAVHGSHSIGPVERRGNAVVLWGLGNLAFACRCTDEAQSMVARVSLTAEGAGPALVYPVRAGLHGRPAALDPEAAQTLDLLKRLGSSPLTPVPLGARF
jgi:poly-gamma-glutamate capsule biosynthesis protein CapA/YwtB (metallophosphatase superfamily)